MLGSDTQQWFILETTDGDKEDTIEIYVLDHLLGEPSD